MSEKQKKAIAFIERMLEIEYHGRTKADAWRFIHDNLDLAKKCYMFESYMSIPVFSANMSSESEVDIDLDRDLSIELLQRDVCKGKSGSECMMNFSKNLFIENA